MSGNQSAGGGPPQAVVATSAAAETHLPCSSDHAWPHAEQQPLCLGSSSEAQYGERTLVAGGAHAAPSHAYSHARQQPPLSATRAQNDAPSAAAASAATAASAASTASRGMLIKAL